MPISDVKAVVEESFRRRIGFKDQSEVINRDGRLLNCAQSMMPRVKLCHYTERADVSDFCDIGIIPEK